MKLIKLVTFKGTIYATGYHDLVFDIIFISFFETLTQKE